MNAIDIVDICRASAVYEPVIVGEDSKDRIFAETSTGWHEIQGKTDTGADTSVGSVENHGQYCVKVTRRAIPQKIRLADHNIMLEAKLEGVMNMRINNSCIGEVTVLLVESPTWTNLLVGKDTLKKNNFVARIP